MKRIDEPKPELHYWFSVDDNIYRRHDDFNVSISPEEECGDDDREVAEI